MPRARRVSRSRSLPKRETRGRARERNGNRFCTKLCYLSHYRPTLLLLLFYFMTIFHVINFIDYDFTHDIMFRIIIIIIIAIMIP